KKHGKKEDGAATEPLSAKGKGKQRQVSEDLSETEDEEQDSDEDDSLSAGKKRGALQNRLRECLIVLHRAKFLQGDIYHALGPDSAQEEDAAYSAAEKIRRELLKGKTPFSVQSCGIN
ncbi:hypothetical protein H0H81_009997, partial [Sphagnurus paluster]